MSEQKSGRWRKATVAFIVIPVLYVLSIGPVLRIEYELWRRGIISMGTLQKSLGTIYAPLTWASERSMRVAKLEDWYCKMWVSDDEMNEYDIQGGAQGK